MSQREKDVQHLWLIQADKVRLIKPQAAAMHNTILKIHGL